MAPRLPASPRPSCRAMERAVSRWSPVTIFTLIPAPWQAATARIASGRGGSSMPCRPRKSSPRSIWLGCSWLGSPSARPMAKASTRWPRPAMVATAAVMRSPSRGSAWPLGFSWRLQRASTTSTEPLTRMRSLPCRVAMYCCSDSNGMASRRGWRSRACCRSRPAVAAAWSRAVSVGSPTSPSCWLGRASLQSRPASRVSSRARLLARRSPSLPLPGQSASIGTREPPA